MLLKLEKFFDRFSDLMGWIAGFLNLVMLVNVFYDSIMRYFFNSGSIALQEMEWHLFSVIILCGISLALLDEAHVRVDFLYDRFSVRTKAVINITGTVCFLLPLALLIFFGSLEFVKDAYVMHEISEDPGGLPYRWLIKGLIPLSFGALIFCSIGYTIKNINLYRSARGGAGEKMGQENNPEEEVAP